MTSGRAMQAWLESALTAAWLVALVCGVATAAAAQSSETCVLLPHASVDVPASTWDRVDAAVAEALRGRGLIVLASRDAQLRMMGQPMEDCGAIECAPDVNRFLGTSFAVLTEVTWHRGRATAVNVVLIGLAADHAAGGQASVGRPTELAEATFAAFGMAWDRWEADRQGQLVIESTPAGAFVEVDGVSVGRAPIRRLVTTGVHTVRLALEGYASETREITIDRHEERTVSVAMTAIDAASSVGADGSGGAALPERGTPSLIIEDRPHWANWLIGGGLLTAGVGLAIQPIYVAAIHGQPLPDRSGFYRFDLLEGLLAGVSAACLVAGVVILAVQPIRESVSVEVGAGSIRLHGTF